MQYGLTQLTQPASEPIARAVAKSWLRLEQNQDDADIDALITAARLYAEDYTGRQLVSCQWKLTLDSFYEDNRQPQQQPAGAVWGNTWRILLERGTSAGFFSGGIIRLPKPPLISVDSVQYVDTNGVLQTVSPAVYMTDLTKEPAWLLPAFGQVWPVAQNVPGAVRVTFTAGFATVPETVKLAMRRFISVHYEGRATAAEMDSVNALLTLGGDYGEYR